MSLNREKLDAAKCTQPGCDHNHPNDVVFLSGACHPGAPVEAYYSKDDKLLRLVCALCHEGVAAIEVAP